MKIIRTRIYIFVFNKKNNNKKQKYKMKRTTIVEWEIRYSVSKLLNAIYALVKQEYKKKRELLIILR